MLVTEIRNWFALWRPFRYDHDIDGSRTCDSTGVWRIGSHSAANLRQTKIFFDSKQNASNRFQSSIADWDKNAGENIDLFSQIALKDYFSSSKMTFDLTNLTYTDFESERATIWSQCYCQFHVEGNFTKEEAKEIFSKTINRLKFSGLLIRSRYQ